ncbi:uncharacterized protein TRIADDRAFT_58124 [Trichoplax adhaerens]|uniref:F-box domain-containing protein n=1 Tax=Trichoplax adhaerens TaxID=10228 RepID=B3S0X9_TRIAD|nr:predicted protein [Trichoplax adhaerens]EDV23141.1 predicted protein [Trichoplax adhaerens]|eukprot:XP_002114051.1 predicted protein [Trichoplax adhaerens]
MAVLSLTKLCCISVAKHFRNYPIDGLERLPTVILSCLLNYLAPIDILQIKSCLDEAGINSDQHWHRLYADRWPHGAKRQYQQLIYLSAIDPTFQVSWQQLYMQKHLQDIINMMNLPNLTETNINPLLYGNGTSPDFIFQLNRDQTTNTPTAKEQIMEIISLCLPYIYRLHLHNCSCRELAKAIFSNRDIPYALLNSIRHLEFHNLRDNCIDFACEIISNSTQLNEVVMRYAKINTPKAFGQILRSISNNKFDRRLTIDKSCPDNIREIDKVVPASQGTITRCDKILQDRHIRQNMCGIEILCLSSYWMDDALVEVLCETLTTWYDLKYLQLIDNGFGILCIDGLKRIMKSLLKSRTKKQLYGLQVEQNFFEEDDENYLAELINTNSPNASFRILTLKEVNLTMQQISVLFQSIDKSNIRKLEKLSMTANIDDNIAAKSLGSVLIHCDNMELCHLPYCELTRTNSEIILKSLRDRRKNGSLTSLNMEGNLLNRTVDIELINSIVRTNNLRYLNLSSCIQTEITDNFIRCIRDCKSLIYLNLSHNKIGDDGINKIGSIFHKPTVGMSLRSIDLSVNNITITGLLALASRLESLLPWHLKWINISGNYFNGQVEDVTSTFNLLTSVLVADDINRVNIFADYVGMM